MIATLWSKDVPPRFEHHRTPKMLSASTRQSGQIDNGSPPVRDISSQMQATQGSTQARWQGIAAGYLVCWPSGLDFRDEDMTTQSPFERLERLLVRY